MRRNINFLYYMYYIAIKQWNDKTCTIIKLQGMKSLIRFNLYTISCTKTREDKTIIYTLKRIHVNIDGGESNRWHVIGVRTKTLRQNFAALKSTWTVMFTYMYIKFNSTYVFDRTFLLSLLKRWLITNTLTVRLWDSFTELSGPLAYDNMPLTAVNSIISSVNAIDSTYT